MLAYGVWRGVGRRGHGGGGGSPGKGETRVRVVTVECASWWVLDLSADGVETWRLLCWTGLLRGRKNKGPASFLLRPRSCKKAIGKKASVRVAQ